MLVHRRRSRVRRSVRRASGDRGDVPGWVLITVMTAGLVSALWVVASRELQRIFESAVTAVTGG